MTLITAIKSLIILLMVSAFQPAYSYLSNDSFIPFGVENGDTLMPEALNFSTTAIPIPIKFPFFNKTFSQVFVSTKGVLSFNIGVTQWVPQKFPITHIVGLAPFWSDIDNSIGGAIYYRHINDVNQIKRIDAEILKAFSSISNYRSTWAFVATFYEVPAFGGVQSINNTFQALIASNGRYSFAIFNFGRLMWFKAFNSIAQSGFNSGNTEDFFILPGSFTDKILNLSESSNVNINGKWIFRIDSNITDGACQNSGYLTVVPHTVYYIGLDDLIVSGPCFNENDEVVLIYDEKKQVKCDYIDTSSVICKTVYFDRIGNIPIKMKINNENVYNGFINSRDVEQTKTFKSLKSIYNYEEFEMEQIEWTDENRIEGDTYLIYLLSSNNELDDLHEFIFVEPTENNSAIIDMSLIPEILKSIENEKLIFENYFAVVRRSIVASDISLSTIIEVHKFYTLLPNLSKISNQLCQSWYIEQTNFKVNEYVDKLPPCWRFLLLQRRNEFPFAFGEFIQDTQCNPRNPLGCNAFHKDAKVCYKSLRLHNEASQQCCYSNDNRLLVGPTSGGSLQRVSSQVSLIGHFINDIYPYILCCKKSANCELYYEKRPSDDGSRWIPPRPAGASGDPHFITLDQVSYAFNGHGEYILLQIDQIEFTVQVRMLPYKTIDGKLTDGTVFKAIAIKSNKSHDSVQFDLNQNNIIDLFINGRLFDWSTTEQTTLDLNGCFISKDQNNSNEFSIQYINGIQIDLKLTNQNDAFLIMLVVPDQYKSKTKGLLGVMDDDINNEFTLPNGTILNLNASNDEEIFYKFGKYWSNTPNTTIFTYIDGYKHSDFTNLSYIPKFISNGIQFHNETLKALAESTCGTNLQCFFDISVTGELSIGKLNVYFNKTLEDTIAAIQMAQDECVPKSVIFANGVVNVTILENNTRIYIYECDNGYCLKGNRVIKCENGVYDKESPKCSICKPTNMATGTLNFQLKWIFKILIIYLAFSFTY